MKVLQLGTYDVTGGAARAAYRLYQGLKDQKELDITMIVQNKRSQDTTIYLKNGDTLIQKIYNKVRVNIDKIVLNFYPKRKAVPWHAGLIGNANLFNDKSLSEFDLYHLHWICDGFVGIHSMKKITKPIIWTLHDTWAMTAGCHYFGDCQKYCNECYKCEQLGKGNLLDLSSYLFGEKYKIYEKLDMTIVAPSRWIAKCAKQSELLKNKRIEVIKYGIDTKVYRPIGQEKARKILGIPEDDLIILFGAMDAKSDLRKGYQYLKDALDDLKINLSENLFKKVKLMMFGAEKPSKEKRGEFGEYYLGTLYDDLSLLLAYNCADVFVAPSREENLPNTVIEAMACGVPCVAFNIGGMPDLIKHKENGYLAKAYNSEDLAKGMEYILQDKNIQKKLSKNAREMAEMELDIKISADKYLKLYHDISS